jgi:uncharacterized protein with FMN-binding domain
VRRVIYALAGTVAGTALLVGAKGPAPADPDASTVVGAEDDPSAEPSPGEDCPDASATPDPAPSKGNASPAARKRVVDGSVVTHRWGPVQVQVTLVGQHIVDVTDLRRPAHKGEGTRINAHAMPILRREALVAQSADIDTVSGATLTSEAYGESLQAALDEAGVDQGC